MSADLANAEAVPVVRKRVAWHELMLKKIKKNRKGDIVSETYLNNIENVRVLFAYHPTLAGCVAFNEFANRIDFTRPVHLHDDIVVGQKGEEVLDTDATAIQAWLQRAIPIDAGENPIMAVMKMEAMKRRYHPARDWLLSLPTWDGKDRLVTFFPDYFGAEDTPANRMKAFYWFLSLVARVMPPEVPGIYRRPDVDTCRSGPGCFVKYTLILEGPQSCGKSHAFNELLPDARWYGFNDLKLDDEKKVGENLANKLIYELREFDKLMKYNAAEIKAVLDRENDRFRDAYARGMSRDHLRVGVFIGTTNENEYLKDWDNTRFWSVACAVGQPITFRIDRAGIRAAGPQLLAEALHYFMTGWNWWPTPEEERGALQADQMQRLEELPIQRRIEAWLMEPTWVTPEWKDPELIPTDVIARCALSISDPHVLNSMKGHIEMVMKRNGWRKASTYSREHKRTARGWVCPMGWREDRKRQEEDARVQNGD